MSSGQLIWCKIIKRSGCQRQPDLSALPLPTARYTRFNDTIIGDRSNIQKPIGNRMIVMHSA